MIDKRKRIYIAGGVAAVILLAVGIWLLLRPAGIYRAVPQSAVVVIETQSWLKTIDKLNTTYTGGEFKKTALAVRLQANLTEMGNMLGGNAELATALNNGTTLVSLHLASADSFDLLFISKFGGIDNETLLSHLRSLKVVRDVTVRTFKDQQLMDVKLKSGKQFTFSNFEGILSFSATTFLTEASVSALLTGESIASESSFNKVRKKVKKDGDLVLYVNYPKVSVIIPVLVQPKLVSLLDDVSRFASWGAYSVSFSNKDIKINGAATALEEEDDDVAVKPEIAAMLNRIPDNAAVVNISDVGAQALANADFKEWIGPTRAFVTLEPLQAEFNEQNMLLIEAKDRNKALAALQNLIAKKGSNIAAVDTFLKDEIYYLENGEVFNQVFNHSFTRLNKVWFTVKGNYVLLCNNIDVLMLSLEKISAAETLAKEGALKTISDNVVYINPQRGNVLLSALLKEGSTAEGFLKQFLTITATWVRKGKIIETNVLMQAGSSRVSKGLLWKTKLKAMCTYPPQVVWNNSTREKEILVQDTANNIYLLTRSGEIIFTRNIGEAIVGSTYQLDYYSNGELQYIFNSANKIYVVDRMGNDVGAYPLKLSSTATAGLSLITDTLLAVNRYFIPCANGAVYGYEGNGKPVSGWSPKNGTGNIVAPVTSFNIGRKIYIASYNTAGTLNLFDVRGNKIWSAEFAADSVNAPVFVQGSNGIFHFVQIAGKELHTVSNDGNVVNSAVIDSANYYTAISTNDSAYIYYFSSGNAIRSYSNANQFLKSAGLGSMSLYGLKRVNVDGNTMLAAQAGTSAVILYDAQLNNIGEFSVPVADAYTVNDLFGRNEVIAITNGTGGNISCIRVK